MSDGPARRGWTTSRASLWAGVVALGLLTGCTLDLDEPRDAFRFDSSAFTGQTHRLSRWAFTRLSEP
jgi:hypothetical protein